VFLQTVAIVPFFIENEMIFEKNSIFIYKSEMT